MNKTRLLNRFLRYIACESETGNESAFCGMMERELLHLGLSVVRDDVSEKCGSNGYNIYANLPGAGEPLLLSAHMDTVSPGRNIEPVIENGVIRAKGDTILGADDKSGVAAILEALESVMEQGTPRRPVEVLLSVCEEAGLLGSKHADYSLIKSRQAIVLDSSRNGCIINRAPANVHLHVEIRGKAAHAGIAPDRGVHALKAAALAVSHIPCGFVDENSVMNVANFLSPGKTNVVPEHASFDMEIRSFREDLLAIHRENAERAVKDACAAFGAEYDITQERHSDVLYVPETSPLLKAIVRVYGELGAPVKIDRTYGGSDATWLSYHGIEALNVGTGMCDAHSLSEHIAVADLERTADMVERMITLL
ncbi:MAG TPA: M20/M25/M40 family metallo-hydrolase [Feifaniaceae bacterium]|nr:M20/M25/M40 family metallo-hydrolase [Feifaniaceae bacterium]